MSTGGWFAEFCEGLSNVDRMSFQISVEVCFHPRSKTVSYDTRRLPHNLIISLRRDTAVSDVQERDYAA